MRIRLAVALLGLLGLCSCGATRVTLEYTVPAYHRGAGGCDPDSLMPIASKGMALLYGRPLNEPSWQFLAAHDVTDLWGTRDRFVLNIRSLEWIMRVVTAIGDSVSCPSNEIYKDARKKR